jgi:hypothetical protein
MVLRIFFIFHLGKENNTHGLYIRKHYFIDYVNYILKI